MSDIERTAAAADAELALADARLPEEYYYASPTLCVIDAVFSIGVRYEGVRAVVDRYCRHYGLARDRASRETLPPVTGQEPIGALAERVAETGAERMAGEVFRNRQRTSSRSGILKAEAVGRFASALAAHRIERFQDIGANLPGRLLEEAVARIPGQRSGISLRYFWMLAGSDDLIKPDRMILRFLSRALGRPVRIEEAGDILTGAAALLRRNYPSLTPRLLDYKIWEFQRSAT